MCVWFRFCVVLTEIGSIYYIITRKFILAAVRSTSALNTLTIPGNEPSVTLNSDPVEKPPQRPFLTLKDEK